MKETRIVKKTKLIKTQIKYPDNANHPTYITEYKCFCGLGKIVEENTPGFNDHFITLSCKRCLEEYCSFIDMCGNDWIVYLKDEKNK